MDTTFGTILTQAASLRSISASAIRRASSTEPAVVRTIRISVIKSSVLSELTRRDPRAYHRHHPHCIPVRIADIGDHLIEIAFCQFALDGRMLSDRFGVTIAPGLDDRSERVARHTNGIYDDVIHSHVLQIHPRQNPVAMPPNKQVSARFFTKARWNDMPHLTRVKRATFEMQHPVILRDEMQITARPRYARQFSNHLVGVRN